MDDVTLARFAELAVDFGANVQAGQIVSLSGAPGKERLVRAIAKRAYEKGAKFVDLAWFDPWIKRARIEHAADDTLEFVPHWYGDRILSLGRERGSAITLSGPVAPGLFDDLDPVRSGRDRLPAIRETGEVVGKREINWTILPGPTPAWAELVYPGPRARRGAHQARAAAPARPAPGRGGPGRGLARACRHARRGVQAAHRARLRRAALRGPGHRLHGRPAAGRDLAGGALQHRRRHPAHAEPPHRGGLHVARPQPRGRPRDRHQAARARGRDGRQRPLRALREGPRGRAEVLQRAGGDAHDHRPRRRRRAPGRGRAGRQRGPHRRARHRLLRHAARRERRLAHRARPGVPVPGRRRGDRVAPERVRHPHRLHDRVERAQGHRDHARTATACRCSSTVPGRSRRGRAARP